MSKRMLDRNVSENSNDWGPDWKLAKVEQPKPDAQEDWSKWDWNEAAQTGPDRPRQAQTRPAKI